ncbi:hypothetical protein IQ07DRAFT_303530 [Pyrenochaeta sp. DS3sAY3a]|nr:hypothetical protein IQ07DRAFT_303530 [Pyrenochaeta sp. DS3sAY3a]
MSGHGTPVRDARSLPRSTGRAPGLSLQDPTRAASNSVSGGESSASSTLNDAKSCEAPAASATAPCSETQGAQRSTQGPPGSAQVPSPSTQLSSRSMVARDDLRASGYPRPAYYRDGDIHPIPPISEDLDAITPAPRQRTLSEHIEDRQRTGRNVNAIPSAPFYRTLIQQIEDMNLTASRLNPNIAYPPERREDAYTLVTSPGVDTHLYHCPSDAHTQTWTMPARAILEHVFPTLLATRI